MEGGRVPVARYVRAVTVTNAIFNPFTTNPGDFVGPTDNLQNPVKMEISAETNPVRVTMNGDNPTASLGINIAAGTIYTVLGWDNIKRLKMFRAGAADSAVVYQVYF